MRIERRITSLLPFHTGCCINDPRSGTVIPTEEESAFSLLQADSSQARNDPFAMFAHLFKPKHEKSRGYALQRAVVAAGIAFLLGCHQTPRQAYRRNTFSCRGEARRGGLPYRHPFRRFLR